MSNENFSRRAMLKAAGAVGAVGAGLTTKAVAHMDKPPAHALEADFFKRDVGKIFTAANADGKRMGLRLSNVEALHSTGARPMALSRRSAFAVVFDGAQGGLKEGVYKIEHPQFGEMELFLQPIEGAPQQYEAIFN